MKLFEKMFGKKPVIMTQFGPTTEKARLQAAYNMRDFPDAKERAEKVLIDQLGEELGLAEARRRYPEAYENETKQ